MMLLISGFIGSFVLLSLTMASGWAASFGELNNNNLQSSATVCMSVGISATISGLNNFRLRPLDNDGAAGAIYTGSDTFHLQSNAPVRVIIEGQRLSNGTDSIETLYSIDGSRNYYDTAADGEHDEQHSFVARAQLGRISSQLAGDYSANVTLTVIPQIGGSRGCGAFVSGFNSVDGWVTLAYEDVYPNTGDSDYNDMVVRYHVAENYNAEQELETIRLQFEPTARGTDYNHSFNLSLDGEIDSSKNITTVKNPSFVGDALIRVTYNNAEGSSHVFHNFDKEDDITIFHNTRSALDGFANVYSGQDWINAKFSTTVDITLANPELNPYSDRGSESLLWYRPFLSVNNTNKDIDLVDINPSDGMIDNAGNPFGLLIPYTWEWPLEKVNIKDAYPLFGDYTSWLNGESASLSDQAMQWYKYPSSSTLIINLEE